MLPKSVRTVLLRLHLWLALTFGSVFVLLGLTGSIICWMHELDHALNPALFSTGRQTYTAEPIEPEMVQAALDILTANPAYGKPRQLMLPATTADVITAWYPARAATGKSVFSQDWSRQVMLDPLTLEVKGERNWGQYGISVSLLIPSLYHLHRYVLLGDTGKTVIAVSGIMLVLMSLIGLFLWLPKPNWKALRQALTVNLTATPAAINFRLHRMLGFFALPVLLLLGFSGAYFNQPQWILPVIGKVLPVTQARKQGDAHVLAGQHITAVQAMLIAQGVFQHARISRLGLPSASAAVYEIRLRQPQEMHSGDGASRVSVDAGSGRIIRVADPLQGQAGDRFLAWLFPLHSGIAFGMPGRIFISCFGLAPLVLMLTGWRMGRKRKSK